MERVREMWRDGTMAVLFGGIAIGISISTVIHALFGK